MTFYQFIVFASVFKFSVLVYILSDIETKQFLLGKSKERRKKNDAKA